MDVLFDAVIIGSGFSGTILGNILARSGWRIAIIDRATHPRFAIGESSTPTADFLLAYLADRWRLPELRPLAAWGTWKDSNPQVVCGKKRGFTYYSHLPDQPYRDCPQHSHSLMVAASQTDYWSDTQWLRSDVDEFLARQCVASGCELIENANIDDARHDDGIWKLSIEQNMSGVGFQPAMSKTQARSLCYKARWLIDAGGGGDFSEKWLGNQRDDAWMKTQTGSVFGHFRGVDGFGLQLETGSAIDPIAQFHADDSAQHHVTDDGWMWTLRFDNGVTSVGMVQPTDRWKSVGTLAEAEQVWSNWIGKYPSIEKMLAKSRPVESNEPWLRWSNRLSRCRQRAVGDGWVQLPTAYGFVDPLHSTGIAHALSGVLRIADMLVKDGAVDSCTSPRWTEYDRQLRSEIEWIDTLVGGCFRSLPSFSKFTAFAAWYFVSTIQFERVMARDPSRWTDGYLTSGNMRLRQKVEESYTQLSHQSEAVTVDFIRSGIQEWNDVGLLEPIRGQRIPHTAPPKYARRIYTESGIETPTSSSGW